MQAAVYEGKERLIVREVPEPVLATGEVLLAIEACCVCGTDLRTYRHGDAKITPPRSAIAPRWSSPRTYVTASRSGSS